ncbi:replicative DNA helicase, partial [Candidatus Poribacteria bacterium]|nr:replicative DNA helicase [Candidatus Poribacteria bacterium]
ADLVLFLYREEYYDRDMATKAGEAEVIIGKQRNGPTATVNLAFRADHMRFDNLSRKQFR